MEKFFKGNKIFIILTIVVVIVFISLVILLFKDDGVRFSGLDFGTAYKGVKSNDDENINSELKLEVGTELPSISDYFKDASFLGSNPVIKYYYNSIEVSDATFTTIKEDKKYLKTVNKYSVTIIDGDKEYNSNLKVIDTTPPEVTLKSVTISKGEKYSEKDFLDTYSDNSNNKTYSIDFKDENYSKFKNIGVYTVVITVCDQSDNCVDKTGSLTINKFELKKVKTIEQEVVIKTEKVKYGVTKVTKAKITYDVYNDGSKKEVNRRNITETIDYATFNGTTAQMKSEASNIYNNLSETRATVLKITNEYRAEKKLDALTIDPDLSVMATIRAMEIAYSDKFSHTRPDGREWSTLWNDYFGNKLKSNLTIGENLAYGYDTDEQACKGWRESDDHYEHIVNETFKKLGVGKYTFNGKTYWVQLFQN